MAAAASARMTGSMYAAPRPHPGRPGAETGSTGQRWGGEGERVQASPPRSRTTGACPGPAGAPDDEACGWTATSTLPGARLTGGEADHRWDLADADAGVDVPWSLEVTEAVDVTIDTAPCLAVGESGLRFLELVSDDTGARWCPSCDVGLCPEDPTRYTTTPGAWAETFTWRPRRWDGPSDYGAEPGELFAPGAYRITIESAGTLADSGEPWALRLEAALVVE